MKLTKVTVKCNLCDNAHVIETEKTEKGVKASIKSSCDFIGDEVNFKKMELIDPESFYNKMEEFMKPSCIPQCFVPVLISNLCRVELGLVAETKFDEIDDFLEIDFN